MLEENMPVSMLVMPTLSLRKAKSWIYGRKKNRKHIIGGSNWWKCSSPLVWYLHLFNPSLREVSLAWYRRPAHAAIGWRARRFFSQRHCRDGGSECLNNAAPWKGPHFHGEWLKVMKNNTHTVTCLFAHWIGRLKRETACRAGFSCAPTAKVMSY